jgi:hypothetical protein
MLVGPASLFALPPAVRGTVLRVTDFWSRLRRRRGSGMPPLYVEDERVSVGSPNTPRWAWTAMVMGLIATVVMIPQALDRSESPLGRAAETRPATSETPRLPVLDDPASILVVGDGYTSGSADGGNGPAKWTAVVTRQLAAAGSPVEMTVSAALGSGYVQRGVGGLAFDDLVPRPSSVPFDVVIFFGSESDVAPADEVQSAAAETYRRVRETWPQAQLLVVGPAGRGGSAPVSLAEVSAGVERAAHAAGAIFVDPLAEGWFTADEGHFIGSAEGCPTDDGHLAIAALIESRLLAVLDAGTAE